MISSTTYWKLASLQILGICSRHHLTKEEAQTFVAPHPDSVEAGNSWLDFHGIDPLNSVHRSGSGDWVTLRIPVDLAEKMLNAKCNIYRHTTSSQSGKKLFEH